MQTGITDKVPIILVNKKYWNGLFKWLKENPLKQDFFIRNQKDLDLLYFVDDLDEIINIIENK